jgi:hypothetical protein
MLHNKKKITFNFIFSFDREGLLAGAAYVNTFYRVAFEVKFKILKYLFSFTKFNLFLLPILSHIHFRPFPKKKRLPWESLRSLEVSEFQPPEL